MINTDHFKQKLEAELAILEGELKSIGARNPANPVDWEAKATPMNELASDPNEVADTIEEFETNSAQLRQLEIRYNEVKAALEQIQNGTYGSCQVCGKPIEPERLEANPAATTCIAHRDS